MISADKQELESRLRQVTLQIRDKEVQVFTDNFAVLSTQSAFLTGLGFGGLTMVPTWGSGDDDDFRGIEVAFFTLVSISIGFNILVLCISSWCMIFGPGLAIRGPEGDSMSRAVLGMYQERKWALRFFWVGLMFTLFSGIALGWLKFHEHTAITMTTIFITFILIFILYVKNVTRPRFAFDKDSSRSPKEFTLDGYDPEKNLHSGVSGSAPAGLPALTEAAEAETPAATSALQEIAWLKQQGFLSEEEAERKKQQILNPQSAETIESTAAAGDKSKASFRQRMFGGSKSGT